MPRRMRSGSSAARGPRRCSGRARARGRYRPETGAGRPPSGGRPGSGLRFYLPTYFPLQQAQIVDEHLPVRGADAGHVVVTGQRDLAVVALHVPVLIVERGEDLDAAVLLVAGDSPPEGGTVVSQRQRIVQGRGAEQLVQLRVDETEGPGLPLLSVGDDAGDQRRRLAGPADRDLGVDELVV